jgi:hypothetical protein
MVYKLVEPMEGRHFFGPVDVDKILRIADDEVARFQVRQLALGLDRRDAEELPLALDVDGHAGLQDLVLRPYVPKGGEPWTRSTPADHWTGGTSPLTPAGKCVTGGPPAPTPGGHGR